MSDTGRIALVTGGAGFIGSHLVAELIARGWNVRCVVRPTTILRWLHGLTIEPITADVATNQGAGALEKGMEGVTAVFHLASASSTSLEHTLSRINVEGTRNVVSAMRSAAPDAQILYCSSIAAAGPASGKRPLNETDNPNPVTAYGRSKLAAEKIIENSGARYVSVRPPLVYGPRDKGMLPLFRLISYGVAPHVGSRSQKLSMLHVTDLARGLVRAAESGGEGVYHMTDGVAHDWDEITGLIARAVGRSARPVAVPPRVADIAARIEQFRAMVLRGKPLITPDRLTELSQENWICDDTRARLDLDYVSEIALADGIRATVEWYRSVGWLVR